MATNLTSACNVPGGDATIRHDRAKHALNDLFLVSKFKTKSARREVSGKGTELGKRGAVQDLERQQS
jgi:hypothetical protein